MMSSSVLKQGWPEILSNSSIALKARLHCARVAFFSSSKELSTHQKEDVVIQWLTCLLKEKQSSNPLFKMTEEQCEVWQLVSAIFESKRFQTLIDHQWLCPVTSSFPQTIINILGNLTTPDGATGSIISTVNVILSTPTLSPVILNSSSLSLNLFICLLDVAINTNWTRVSEIDGNSTNQTSDSGKHKRRRLSVKKCDEHENSHISGNELEQDKILKALLLLQNDVHLQLISKGTECISLCSLQYLHRICRLKIALGSFSSTYAGELVEALDILVMKCLYNAELVPHYDLFFADLNREDNKVNDSAPSLHIMFSNLSEHFSRESRQVVKVMANLVMNAFLRDSFKSQHVVSVTAVLIYLLDISLPVRGVLDYNCMLLSFIDKKAITVAKKETILATIFKVFSTQKSTIKENVPELKILAKHLLDYLIKHHKVSTGDGVEMFRNILGLFLMSFLSVWPKVFRKLMSCCRTSFELQGAYEIFLSNIFDLSSKNHNIKNFLIHLMKGIIFLKGRFFPILEECDNEIEDRLCQQCLPASFISKMVSAMSVMELVEYTDILTAVTDSYKRVLEGLSLCTGYCSSECGKIGKLATHVMCAVLIAAKHNRTVRVAGFCSSIANNIAVLQSEVLLPLLKRLATAHHLSNETKPDSIDGSSSISEEENNTSDLKINKTDRTHAGTESNGTLNVETDCYCVLLMLSHSVNHVQNVLLQLVTDYSNSWQDACLTHKLPITAARGILSGEIMLGNTKENLASLLPNSSSAYWTQCCNIVCGDANLNVKTLLLKLILQRIVVLVENIQQNHLDNSNKFYACNAGPSDKATDDNVEFSLERRFDSASITEALEVLRAQFVSLAVKSPKVGSGVILTHLPVLNSVNFSSTESQKLSMLVLQCCLEDIRSQDWLLTLADDSFGLFAPHVFVFTLIKYISCIEGTEVCSACEKSCSDSVKLRIDFINVISKMAHRYANDINAVSSSKFFVSHLSEMKMQSLEFLQVTDSGCTGCVGHSNETAAYKVIKIMHAVPIGQIPDMLKILSSALFMLVFLFSTTTEKNCELNALQLGLINKFNAVKSLRLLAKAFDISKLYPALITRMISISSLNFNDDSDKDELECSILNSCSEGVQLSVGAAHNIKARLMVQLNVLLHNICIFATSQLQVMQKKAVYEMASFLISCARKHSATGASAEERYLSPAWTLIRACMQVLESSSKNSDQEVVGWCMKAVRRLGSWCLRILHRADQRSVCASTAAHCLASYTALLRLEHAIAQRNLNITNEEDQSTVLCTFESVNRTQNSTMNVASDETGIDDLAPTSSKGKRWQRYIKEGVSLAEICLESNISCLQASAMCFIIAVRDLSTLVHLPTLPQNLCWIALNLYANAPSVIDANIMDKGEDVLHKKQSVLRDVINNKRISLDGFLSDCSLDTYKQVLDDLLAKSTDFKDSLSDNTSAMWNIVITVPVDAAKNMVKRTVLSVLVRAVVAQLSVYKGLNRSTKDKSCVNGLSGGKMLMLLDLLSMIVRSKNVLTHVTTVSMLAAVTASTDHLSLQLFIEVWQKQTTLMDLALLLRVSAWSNHIAGLMLAVSSLFERLVLRSSQSSVEAQLNKEALTGCCLTLERLIRRLDSFKTALAPVGHHLLGALVISLHHTTVIAPVKSVLDQQVFHVFKLCQQTCLEHLLVALPVQTRPLLQHYHHNYSKYYAFRKYRE